MNFFGNALLILSALCTVLYIVILMVRKSIQKSLVTKLNQKDFQAFDALINQSLTKMLFSSYNLEYLKLSRYLLAGNRDKINQQFDLLARTAKPKQKKDIFFKAFEFYAFNKDEEKAKVYLEELHRFNDQNIIDYTNLIYDVIVLNKTNHIEELEKNFDELSPNQKKFYSELLYVQYKNKNDEAKQKYYKDYLKSAK